MRGGAVARSDAARPKHRPGPGGGRGGKLAFCSASSHHCPLCSLWRS